MNRLDQRSPDVDVETALFQLEIDVGQPQAAELEIRPALSESSTQGDRKIRRHDDANLGVGRTEQDAKGQYVIRAASGLLSVILPALFVSRWGIHGIIIGRLAANVVFSAVGPCFSIRTRNATSRSA